MTDTDKGHSPKYTDTEVCGHCHTFEGVCQNTQTAWINKRYKQRLSQNQISKTQTGTVKTLAKTKHIDRVTSVILRQMTKRITQK